MKTVQSDVICSLNSLISADKQARQTAIRRTCPQERYSVILIIMR
nr:MAG TPA: hypothetical protein [Caudoviricetes sp.]